MTVTLEFQGAYTCTFIHTMLPSSTLVEVELWLADVAFFLSSALMAGMQPLIRARELSYSPDPSLTLTLPFC